MDIENNKEMSFEEYKEALKTLSKNVEEHYKIESKKEFKDFLNKIEYYKEFDKKIDNLAKEYNPDFDIILGYYAILDHCIKKIKDQDVNFNKQIAKSGEKLTWGRSKMED